MRLASTGGKVGMPPTETDTAKVATTRLKRTELLDGMLLQLRLVRVSTHRRGRRWRRWRGGG